MFNYSTKTKVIAILVFLLLIAGVIWLVNYNRSRNQDLLTVIQAKNMAIALEQYFDQHQNYPVTATMPIANITQITDQGINQAGTIVYWRNNSIWPRPATYVGQSDNYAIYFTLKNSWSVWGLKSTKGGVCGFTKNVVFQCRGT